MGAGCSTTKTQRDAITIPKVINVKNKGKLRTNSPTQTTTNPTPNSNETQNQGNPVETRQPGEDPDQVVTSPSPQLLSFKYNFDKLGIGEYYLEKEMNEMIFQLPAPKRKKYMQNIAKWDGAIVQQRGKLQQTNDDESLYNYVDLCIRSYGASKPKQYNKMLRKGISQRHRWSIWKVQVEIDKYYEKNLYETFKKLSSCWETDIKKDVHRTFPTEAYFSSYRFDRIGQITLFNVLKAVSLYFPNVGYAQSMNFLTGFLLLINGGNELEAFWMFVTLARDYRFLLMGMFEKGFPLLEFYTYMFYEVLEAEIPELHDHIKSQQIPDLLWLFKWFLTLFLYSFPQKHVIKIWDFIVLRGMLSIIQISISVVKFLEKDMIGLDTFGLDQLFKHLKGDITGNIRSQPSMVENSEAEQSQQQPSEHQKKGTVILNHLNVPENVEHNSVHNELSEIQYSFKQFDIDKILEYADTISLTPEKVTLFANNYYAKTQKKLPELYEKFFTNYDTIINSPEMLQEFQTDVDLHIMKCGLYTNPLANEPEHREPIITLMDEGDVVEVLKLAV